jgi:16S rRNA (cytosine1402-N4)-methyltransferase
VSDRGSDHVPVLLDAVVELLDPRGNQCLVDCTVGLGGHALVLGERLGAGGRLIAVDWDEGNLARARERLTHLPCRCDFIHGNFADIDELLLRCGAERIDRLLVDLGLSSNQLDDSERGFSFQRDGPLDMRIDRQQELSALELVNRLSERELADLIYFNAQERFSRRIAKRICQARHKARIRSTRHLAEVVASAVEVDPASRKSKIHPATRTFLALRMAVNQEQENLRLLLSKAPKVLAPEGRIAVISFHSVEDRAVKVDFRARVQEGLYTIVNKRPVIAGSAEREANPRSRSAKLRVAERTAQPFSAHLEQS